MQEWAPLLFVSSGGDMGDRGDWYYENGINARLSITKCDSVVQRSGMNFVGLVKYLSSSPITYKLAPLTLSISPSRKGGGNRS